MTDRSRAFRVLLVATLAAPLFAGAALASAAEHPMQWAPEKSLFYFGVSNCDEAVDAFERTNFGRMLEDPAVKKVAQPWTNVLKKLRALAAKKLQLENPKILELQPHGAVVAYLAVGPPKSGETLSQPLAAVVLDMGEDLSKARALADAVVARSLENGGKKEKVEAAGGEITVLRFAKAEVEDVDTDAWGDVEPSGVVAEILEILESEDLGINPMMLEAFVSEFGSMEPPEEVAFAFQDTRVVLAADEASARVAMQTLKRGGEGSLAQTECMRTLKRHCAEKATASLVLNVPEIVALYAKEEPDDAPKMIRAMGLDDLGPVVATFELAPESGVDSRMRGYWPIANATKGIGRMVMMANGPTQPPAFVSSEAAMCGVAYVDIDTIVDEFIEITARMDPADGEAARAAMKVALADGTTLDLREQVFKQMPGPWFGQFTASKPYGPDDLNFVVGLRHKSREAIDKLTAMIPPGMLVSREMMGATIFDIPMMMGAAMAVTDRAIVPIGTKNGVESYIRSEGKSEGGGMAEDPLFRKVVRQAPKESCVFLYADGLKMFDAQIAIAGDETLPEMAPMFPFGATFPEYIRWNLGQNGPFSVLDDPKVLRKYGSAQIVTVVNDNGKGLRFDAVGVAP